MAPPQVNTEAMNLHLDGTSRRVTPGAHAVLALDGAGWHKPGGALRLPGNISLLTLPPYSPELDPVEGIWQFLRQNHLSNRVFETCTAIVDACCEAWNALMAQPERIRSITTRSWMQANATSGGYEPNDPIGRPHARSQNLQQSRLKVPARARAPRSA